MPPSSKSVKSYSDVHQAFEAAAIHGSLRLQFHTAQNATTFASRANAYRVLLRKQNEAAGRDHSSEFDHLMVCRKQGDNFVEIKPRGFDFVATLPTGEPLQMNKQTLTSVVQSPHEVSSEEQDMEDFLASFSKEQGK